MARASRGVARACVGDCPPAQFSDRLRGHELPHLDLFPAPSRAPQVVVHLLLQPAFRAAAEALGEPDGHLGRNAEAAVEQHGQRVARHAESLGGRGHGQSQGLDALPPDDGARVRRIVHEFL